MLTMGVVVFGWLIFRAPSLAALRGYLIQMPRLGEISAINGQGLTTALPFVCLVLIAEWFGRHGEHALQKLPRSVILRWGIYLAIAALILDGMPSAGGDFIYGQF